MKELEKIAPSPTKLSLPIFGAKRDPYASARKAALHDSSASVVQQPPMTPKLDMTTVIKSIKAGDKGAGWVAIEDPKSGKLYFHHKEKKKTVWKCPPDMAEMIEERQWFDDSPALPKAREVIGTPSMSLPVEEEFLLREVPPGSQASSIEVDEGDIIEVDAEVEGHSVQSK